MKRFLTKLFVRVWNRLAAGRSVPARDRALDLGAQVTDGEVVRHRIAVPQVRRAEHIVILGKTGRGKSFLNRHLAEQDIRAGRGFVYFDLHCDTTPFIVGTVATRERIDKEILSERLIIVDPADPDASVGLNPLEPHGANSRFVQISEFTEVLRKRWHLESFGARTDELLRNSL